MSGFAQQFPWGNPAILNLSCLINNPAVVFMHATFSRSLPSHTGVYCSICASVIVRPAGSLMPYDPSSPRRLPVNTVRPSPPLSRWFKSVPSYLWLVVNVFCCSKGSIRLAGHRPRLHSLFSAGGLCRCSWKISWKSINCSNQSHCLKSLTSQLEINLPLRV